MRSLIWKIISKRYSPYSYNSFSATFSSIFPVTVVTDVAYMGFWNFKFKAFKKLTIQYRDESGAMEKWKITNTLEMANHGTKRSEIWHSVVLVQDKWGTFDLLVFNVNLGSFRALFSQWPVTPSTCNLSTWPQSKNLKWNLGLMRFWYWHV